MLAMDRPPMAELKVGLMNEPSSKLPLDVRRVGLSKPPELKRTGMTHLVFAQFAVQWLAVSYRGYVRDPGRILFSGRGPTLLADDGVRRLYPGG